MTIPKEAQQGTKPVVYVLFDGVRNFYVGSTRNMVGRLARHLTGRGSRITKYWYLLRRDITLYWVIVVDDYAIDTELIKLETLVVQTLRRQNPQYDIGGLYTNCQPAQARV